MRIECLFQVHDERLEVLDIRLGLGVLPVQIRTVELVFSQVGDQVSGEGNPGCGSRRHFREPCRLSPAPHAKAYLHPLGFG